MSLDSMNRQWTAAFLEQINKCTFWLILRYAPPPPRATILSASRTTKRPAPSRLPTQSRPWPPGCRPWTPRVRASPTMATANTCPPPPKPSSSAPPPASSAKKYSSSRRFFRSFGVFLVAWTPLAVLLMLPDLELPMWLYLVTVFLAHGSTATNSIVYFVSNEGFRRGFQKTFDRVMHFSRRSSVTPGNGPLSRAPHGSIAVSNEGTVSQRWEEQAKGLSWSANWSKKQRNLSWYKYRFQFPIEHSFFSIHFQISPFFIFNSKISTFTFSNYCPFFIDSLCCKRLVQLS